MTHDFNPRYVEYARYHGLTPQDCIQTPSRQKKLWVIWMNKKIHECGKEGHDFMGQVQIWGRVQNEYRILDQEKYTNWLVRNIHNKLMEHCL